MSQGSPKLSSFSSCLDQQKVYIYPQHHWLCGWAIASASTVESTMGNNKVNLRMLIMASLIVQNRPSFFHQYSICWMTTTTRISHLLLTTGCSSLRCYHYPQGSLFSEWRVSLCNLGLVKFQLFQCFFIFYKRDHIMKCCLSSLLTLHTFSTSSTNPVSLFLLSDVVDK